MSITDNLATPNVALTLRREGKTVAMIFTCQDDYAALMLVDKLQHCFTTGGGATLGGFFEVQKVETP